MDAEMIKEEKLKKKLLERGATDFGALMDAFEFARATGDHGVGNDIRKAAREQFRTRGSAAIELYQKSLIFDGTENFDCFMRAVEFNRPAAEQFWLPRRGKLMPVCNALQDMEDGKLDELFLSCPPRVGKALADDTPVLTRNGWKKHGDLRVGDEVIGLDGNFKRVIAVHPKCELNVRLVFTNGESIVCHENHEWVVFDRAIRKNVTVETKRFEKAKPDCNTPGHRGHRYRFQLPKHDAVVGEQKQLPLDPYTFGVWLGDGVGKNPIICNAPVDVAIIEKIARNGIKPRWETTHKTTGVKYYGYGFRFELQGYGMCHSRRKTEKYIPDDYLTASKEQRLELLAGLLDTDGTYARKEHRYMFSTCSERLRDTFCQLVSTFGWRVNISTYPPSKSSSGVVGRKNTYAVAFNPDCEIPCALERKQNHEFSKQRAIALKSVERITPVIGNCITVEGDGIYLVGRYMIPTHNSTLMLFFFLWVMGRNSERSNLYCSYTDSVVGVLYNGILEVIGDTVTYAYKDVFPGSALVSTNAKDLLINLDRKKRYASFTGRSLYGTLNGACDCNGYLVGDDLVSGIEEAMSKDRLANVWAKVDNNMLPRAKESAKVLWIGTRWSLLDPQGKRMDLLENDPKYSDRVWKVLNTPALDENDESNFEYQYGVGFSTDYYQQRRASFERNSDTASWLAQYMGMPVERSGRLFEPDDLRYFNGVLPEGDPDRIFTAVDPAYGGGDFTAAPIIVQFGDDLYVVDVVFSTAEKNVTQPLIVNAVKKYGIQAMKIEGTRMTASYGQEVDRTLRDNGIRINVVINTSHFTGNGKQQRIFDKAPEIRERMIFLQNGLRSKDYQLFMQNVYSFTINGKNKHDDACDSLAMAIDFSTNYTNRAEVFKRPW